MNNQVGTNRPESHVPLGEIGSGKSQSRRLRQHLECLEELILRIVAAGTLSEATLSCKSPNASGETTYGTSPLRYASCPASRARVSAPEHDFTPIQLLDPPVNLPSYFCQPLLRRFLLFKQPQPFADQRVRGRSIPSALHFVVHHLFQFSKVMAIVQFYPYAVLSI